MTSASLRLYYHLYNGPAWRPVWALHRPALQRLLVSGIVERLVVCCYGFSAWPAEVDDGLEPIEVRASSRPLARVNEFDTLAQLRRDCCESSNPFEHVGYLHGKGGSAPALTPQARSWTEWLARALLVLCERFGALARGGFDAAGSNLAWGAFDHFEPPRLHYSGNFWCATRETILATRPIDLAARESSVRHGAEWWLGTAADRSFFNLFCSGLDHYRPEGGWIDHERLGARLATLAGAVPCVGRARAQAEFVRREMLAALPSAPARRLLSKALLAALPYARAPRLYSAHDRAMRMLGSRKSTYFYCGET